LTLLSAMVFLYCFYQIRSFDIWLHIKTGWWIWKNADIPRTQLYSFSLGNAAWVDHSWLFQAILYPFYRFMGINGVILIRALGILSIYSLLLKGLLKSRKYFILSFLAVSVTMFIARSRFLARPELFTMLALLSVIYILKFHTKDRYIYILIPLQMLWVNMHGYFILGPIIVALFLISQLCENRIKLPFEWNSNRLDRLYIRRVSLIFLAMMLVLFINPYGIGLLLYPFRVIINGIANVSARGYIFSDISELKPIAIYDIFTGYGYFLLHVQIVIFVLSLLINIRRARIFDILIFSLFLGLSINSNRHTGIFAISAGFLSLCNLISAERERFLDIFQMRDITRRILYISVLTVSSLLVMWLMKESTVYFYRLIPYKYVADPKGNTARLFFNNRTSQFTDSADASEFLVNKNINGNIFNFINNASYLIFRLYPESQVFVDARTELYTDAGYKRYFNMLSDPKIFEKHAEKLDINIVLLPCAGFEVVTVFFKYLYDSDHWRLVFFDGNSFIFLRNIKQYKKIIRDHRYDIRDFDLEIDDQHAEFIKKSNYNVDFLFKLAGFFINIDMPEKAIEILDKAQKASNNSFDVHSIKAVAFAKLGSDSEAENEFHRAYVIDPNNIALLQNMAVFYFSQHKPYAAIECLQQALEIDPDNIKTISMYKAFSKGIKHNFK